MSRLHIELWDERRVEVDFMHFEKWRMELAVSAGYSRKVMCPCGTHDYYLPEAMPRFNRRQHIGIWCKPPTDALHMLFAAMPAGEEGEAAYIDAEWCGRIADRIDQVPIPEPELSEFGRLFALGLRECHGKGNLWLTIE